MYWVGPILGGIAAALLYHHAFTAPNLGPLKIIERYTAVVTDENEVSIASFKFYNENIYCIKDSCGFKKWNIG